MAVTTSLTVIAVAEADRPTSDGRARWPLGSLGRIRFISYVALGAFNADL